jgi:hypothetical protein
VGIEDTIEAHRQTDNLIIQQPQDINITAIAQADNIIIKDVEDSITNKSNSPDDVIAVARVDEIVITRPPTVEITVRD